MTTIEAARIIVLAWLAMSAYNVMVALPLFHKATKDYFSSSSDQDGMMLIISIVVSPVMLVALTVVIIFKSYEQGGITMIDRYEKLVERVTGRS